MKMSLRHAAAKALADVQMVPGWEQLDEQLQQSDPFGTNMELILLGISEKLAHTQKRPVEVLSAEIGERGEQNPYLIRALLHLVNDLRVPAAIWPRERDGKTIAELVVYES